ncbi:uncharacterized protein G2W53_042004 [Senna tora]|uniref:Uncharacterized protein n=1 Tax=Senna tora TaxID=362788 RepID=A0A834VYJ6_9FABA|nr:uncharacterized protein G2W53_042004 [Senna tora]
MRSDKRGPQKSTTSLLKLREDLLLLERRL